METEPRHGLQLCAVEPSDAREMWLMENDSRQWMLNGMTAPFSLHNLEVYAENYDADPYKAGQIRLVVRDSKENTVGLADLYEISALNRTAFVGVYVKPEYRRRGIATEIVRMLAGFARNVLSLRALAARIADNNIPSIHVFANAGFEPAGRLRCWLEQGGRRHDMLTYQKILTADD